MNNVLEIIVRAVDNASQVISGISQSGFTMSRDMEMACLKVGAALTGIGISAKLAVDNINSAFLSFDNAMTEVKALGSLTDEEFEKIRQKALDLSSTMPLAADDVAKAMYSMVSVGWEYGEMMEAIEPASKLAVAGSADLADTIDAVIAVMDAYGDTGITANEITAIFAKGVGEGKWELNDFMQEMMKNINVASNLGISFQELAAYNVALQPTFTDSTEAGTAFKQMLMNLIESKNIAAIEGYGVAVKNTDGSFRGLIPIITELDGVLSEHYGEVDKNTIIAEIFGARSVNAFNALARKKDDLPELIERMGDLNFIEDQFGVKIESTGAKLEIANNKMTNAKIALGDAMAPATIAAAEAMATLAGVIERLPGPLQTVAGTALMFGQSLIVVGPLLMALPTLMSAIGPASQLANGAMLGLKAAMAGVSTSSLFVTGSMATLGVSLGALLIPIAAVVAAAVLLYAAWKTNFLGIRDIAGEVASWVKDRWEGVKDTFARVGEAIAPSVDKLKSALGNLFKTIDDVFKKFSGGSGIVDLLKSAFDMFGRVVDAVVRKLGSELSRALTTIIDGLTKLIEWVGKAVEWFEKLADNKVVQAMLNFRDSALDAGKAVFDSLFPAVQKTNDELEETPGKLDKTAGSLDKTAAASDKAGNAVDDTTTSFNKLGTEGSAAMNNLAGNVETAVGTMIGKLQAFVRTATGVWQGLQEIVTQGSSYLWYNETSGLWEQMVPAADGQGYVPIGSPLADQTTGISPSGLTWKLNSDGTYSTTYDSAGNYVGPGSVYAQQAASSGSGSGTSGTGTGTGGYYAPSGNSPTGSVVTYLVASGDGTYQAIDTAGSSDQINNLTPEQFWEYVAQGFPVYSSGNMAGSSWFPGVEITEEYQDQLTALIGTQEDATDATENATTAQNQLTTGLNKATDATEEGATAQNVLSTALNAATATTYQQGAAIGNWSVSLADSTAAMTNNTMLSFDVMGTGMESITGATALGVTSQFGQMGERSISSTNITKRSMDGFFDFLEARAAALTAGASASGGCSGAGCGSSSYDGGGFDTDTGWSFTPIDWSVLPPLSSWNNLTPSSGWNWNLGLPPLTSPLPQLASGGDILESGKVIVGEEGPEMLNLPRGASVVPLTHSERSRPGGMDAKEMGKLLRDNGGVRDIHIHVKNLIGVPDKNSLRPVVRVIRNLLNEEGNRRSDRGASI